MCQTLLHFFCVAECVVSFCFVFFVNRIFLVMQLLRHSSICKLVCTLNCSVGCSLDHSLGCILEYSLGCSLGCNLDCNQDRFLNYNVDCNEICNMKKVMQRKKTKKEKKTKTNGWGSVSNTNDVQHEDVCVKFFYIFFCVAECVVLFCFVFFGQSHFFGYAIVKA